MPQLPSRNAGYGKLRLLYTLFNTFIKIMSSKKKYAQTREELMLKLINRQTPRAHNGDSCTYDPNINGGCAIGCDLHPTTIKKLIQYGTLEGGLSHVFEFLPKRLQKMGKGFLISVQEIHDRGSSWIGEKTAKKSEDGLVWDNEGRKRINNIIAQYKLNIKPLNLIP